MRRIENGLAFMIKHKAESLMPQEGKKRFIRHSFRTEVNRVGIYPIDNEEFFLY